MLIIIIKQRLTINDNRLDEKIAFRIKSEYLNIKNPQNVKLDGRKLMHLKIMYISVYIIDPV